MPETAIAPAPPAPPAPSPAPAPSVPRPAPSPAPSQPASDPFRELQGKVKLPDAPPKEPAKEPGKEPSKDPVKGAVIPPKPAASDPYAGKPPKELRQRLETLETELAGKTKAYTDLETKIAEYERKGVDTSVLTKRLEDMEKALEEREAKIRMLNVEETEDFKKAHIKPFEEAMAYAKQDLAHLTILDYGEDEGGNKVVTGQHPATWADFVKLYRMPLNQAFKESKEMFGDASGAVMEHIRSMQRLDNIRANALNEAKENVGKVREQERAEALKQQEQEKTRRQQAGELFRKVNQDLVESVEDYRDAPDEKELANLRNEGYKLWDWRPESLDQRITKDAHIRQIVGAHAPLKMKVLRLEKKLADAMGELDGYKEKTPSPKRPGGGDPPADDGLDWEQRAIKDLK